MNNVLFSIDKDIMESLDAVGNPTSERKALAVFCCM
jgi:hypothetical protein